MQPGSSEVEQSGMDTNGSIENHAPAAPQGGRSCEEARRLLDLFGAAVQELVKLHEEQFQAVVAGDQNANRFDILIHDANEKKQNAKYVYMRHLEEHGCSV